MYREDCELKPPNKTLHNNFKAQKIPFFCLMCLEMIIKLIYKASREINLAIEMDFAIVN